MPFQKGHKYANGRPKGSENKEKKELRKALTKLAEGGYSKFAKELAKLEGKDYIDRYISLLEYTTPKLNRTDHTNDGEKFDFNISDAELIDKLNEFARSIAEKGTE